MARAICLRLFWHCARAAASRTLQVAGISKATEIATMARTTSTLTSADAGRRVITFLCFPLGYAANRAAMITIRRFTKGNSVTKQAVR